ncbi:MAG: enoyl-CoA hydratase/isomerase family protein [bacterium]|nr:enoyl-CoA hydratase/isomerase family protein [bacterium]
MSETDLVQVELVDQALVLRLNRPSRGNALVPEMRDAVLDAWRRANSDDAVRVVVVTGPGTRHFCTGVDVGGVAATGKTTTGDGPVADEIVWSPLLAGVQKPVICAVNGLAAGGGLHFVADADIVVAGEHVEFLDTHVSVGMVGGVENVSLTRRLPIGTVLRMTLQGRSFRLSARRAFDLGLVDELCPPGEELSTALGIAAEIAKNSPEAVRLSKQAVWDSIGLDHLAAAEQAWDLVKEHRSHPDFLEGPRAFADARPPAWVTRTRTDSDTK